MITLTSACGAASPAPASRAPARPPPPAEAPASLAPPARDGQIARLALGSVLDAGLGRFLQGVVTEPELRDGRFVGFRVESFYPGDARLAAVDLQPGDVVVRVNGQSIERPEEALRVWNGLRVASELLIEYQRAGEPRELRFEIVD